MEEYGVSRNHYEFNLIKERLNIKTINIHLKIIKTRLTRNIHDITKSRLADGRIIDNHAPHNKYLLTATKHVHCSPQSFDQLIKIKYQQQKSLYVFLFITKLWFFYL